MQEPVEIVERRTATDVVFERLYEEIVSLKLMPGTKLSEQEIARRFGVSRQPVRDAFNRLGNLDLLLIRPQKATEVRGFSMPRIEHARFVRLAVELEVLRDACSVWTESHAEALERIIDRQQQVIDRGQPEKFHELDYRFHRLICELGGHPLAFETIEDCKRKIDRLCVLSLGRAQEAATLVEDHRRIAHALRRRSAEEATAAARLHLGRLDETIADIHRTHSEYFE
ncbi:MAG: GntR family transcriptional regulator [Alphaproteobacteria bacterium]|nr:MAG: GntR family transcriptional regulator [Alphaproteobacteria bacterium]